MKHLYYCGDIEHLRGKGALVKDDPMSNSRGVLVQFDDISLLPEGVVEWTPEFSLGHRWWSFYSYEFQDSEPT